MTNNNTHPKNIIPRLLLKTLIDSCFQQKAIILYGPRQVGKTTLTRSILDNFSDRSSLYISGDDIEVQELWKPSITLLTSIIQNYEIIIIDEAQKIKDIGLIIKILVDNFPHKQVIATGSSSFDLAYSVSEPLTGRALIYTLYPLSVQEIYNTIPVSSIALEQRMLYGSYPEVIQSNGLSPQEYLRLIFDNYLYKDILSFEGIKKHSLIIKLIQALALQIGNEFSYLELANTLGSNKDTIAKYITILEQAFIIKTLSPLTSNQRREIKSHKKVYFWDLGVRNAAINNFNPLTLRNDVGQLRENFCFIERTKYIHYNNIAHKQYFWRETAGAEIDYVEQYGDQYDCREYKYSVKKGASLPAAFAKYYPQNSFEIIRPDTIEGFIK